MQQLVGQQLINPESPAVQRMLALLSSSLMVVQTVMLHSAKGKPGILSACSESDSSASSSGQAEEEQHAILVGTVELSFAASTRARYLTLNAPVVRLRHNIAGGTHWMNTMRPWH